MKVHEAIIESKPDFVAPIKANAKKLGLDVIDFEEYYTLKKLGAKMSSPRGYPDAYTVCKGTVRLIGNEELVAVYVAGISEWFKTSAIVKVKTVKEGILLETLNSIYLLES